MNLREINPRRLFVAISITALLISVLIGGLYINSLTGGIALKVFALLVAICAVTFAVYQEIQGWFD